MRGHLLGTVVLLAAAGTAAAADSSSVDRGREALRAGVGFLLRTQNPDGSWGYHAQKRPRLIWAPVPGAHRSFRVATTALCLMALLGAEGDRPGVKPARKKALEHLLAHARVKRSQGAVIYSVWAYGYGLQALARCLGEADFEADGARIRARMGDLIEALALYQAVDGGWGYFDFRAKTYRPSGDSMSFTTAAILIALDEAKERGVSVPPPMVRKAVRCLWRCRTPEKSYIYSFWWRTRPIGGINRPQGSLTRTPCCDLALHLTSEGIGPKDLEAGVAGLLENRKFARMALRRPIPHNSWYAVSGYFYLFGYCYAAECWRLLPEGRRGRYRDGLIEEVLRTRQPDGSFWDYPLYGYHKPYGTAYSVLALTPLVEGS